MKQSNEVIDPVSFNDFPQTIRYVKEKLHAQMIEDRYISGNTSLDQIDWQPWFGTKDTKHLKNVGDMIGFFYGPYVFRLDYDPSKGFHINYSNTQHGSNFKHAVKIDYSEWKLRNIYNNNPNLVLQNWSVDLKRAYNHLLEPENLAHNTSYQTALAKNNDPKRHTLGKNRLDREVLQHTIWGKNEHSMKTDTSSEYSKPDFKNDLGK